MGPIRHGSKSIKEVEVKILSWKTKFIERKVKISKQLGGFQIISLNTFRWCDRKRLTKRSNRIKHIK